MDPAFSRRGESATAFERELLQRFALSAMPAERDLWIALARRIGLDALFAVLDEMGGRHAWVPTRESLLQPAWLELRAAEMRRLSAEGMPYRKIAARFGVDLRVVARVMTRGPSGATRKRETQRA